jgi:hypothetical protein
MTYAFTSSVWLYPGFDAAWHFISIPKKEGEAIKKSQQNKPRKGFGSVRVKVTIGKSSWQTSIFPDKKSGSYVMPLKANVRKKEGIMKGDSVTVTLRIL